MARLDDVKLQQLIDLVQELKTDLNNLRTDFRAHNHESATDTYASNRIVLAASANSFTGTAAANTAVSAAAASALKDYYNP